VRVTMKWLRSAGLGVDFPIENQLKRVKPPAKICTAGIFLSAIEVNANVKQRYIAPCWQSITLPGKNQNAESQSNW